MKKNWSVKKLGEVCCFDKQQGVHENLPYVGMEHVESKTARFVGSLEAQGVKSSTFRFSQKHVLFGRLRPYLNKVLAPDFEGHCSTEIFPIKPAEELSREYLLYWFLSGETVDRINATCTGARMPRANMKEVFTFDFPVPPLEEQVRIVALLDEAFEGIATAKAAAEQNLQNARDLFNSHLNSVFSQKGDGWVETTLGDAFKTATGTTPSKRNDAYYGDFMPFVKPPELCDSKLDSATDNLSKEGSEVARTLPPQSILVSCIGNLGKIGLNTVPVAFNQQINAILPDESKALPELMFYQALSSSFREQLEGLAGGTTVPIVNKSKFNSVSIVFPSVNEQKEIVARFDTLSAKTHRLETIYEQKAERLEELKASLLDQAFNGEL